MVNVYTWLKGQWKSLSLAFVATLLSTFTLQANCCYVPLPSLSENGGCAVMSNVPVGQCGDAVEWMWARNNNGSIQGMTPFSTNQVTTYCPEESGLYRLCLRVVGCSTIYETSDIYVEASECNGSITGLFIYDQYTDAPAAGVPALTNGGVVNLSQLPANFYLAAETNGNIESVVLTLNGNSNTENHAPYTIPGGAENGNNLTLSPGTYTLSAAAFSQDHAAGEQCDYISVTFTVASDTCVSIENGTSPYSIDDPVFQEVISNDPYCCNTAWDVICEDQYTEINTTGTLIETCVLDGYQFPGGRVFWLPNFGTDFKATASGLFLDKFDDGTARIYGEVARIADGNKKFKVSVWYNNFSTYSEWIAQGLQAKSPELGDETSWVFYSLDQSKVSTLIGLHSYAGEVLYIQQQDNPYGLQIGDGANDLNTNPNGLSMWFDYNGTTSGHGDINATYDCGDEIEPTVDTFELDCEDALRVAIQGIGLEGQQCASLNIDASLPGDVEYIILETVWKGSNPPATITFTADGNDYIADAQVVLEGNGNDQGNKRAYRVEVPAASNVGVCRPAGFNNNLRSFVAYVFRSNAGSVSAGSGEFVGRHLYLSSYTMTLTVPAAPEARDIVVTLPLSDMSDDGRNADFHLTAGPVQKHYSVNGNTNGLSLNITPFVLENVPGDVTEVEIELISDPNNNPSSFLAAGLAIADAQCDTPEEEQICEVVGYNGPGTRHFIFFSAYGTNYTSDDEGLQFIQYVDGTAKMTGTIFAVNNPNKQFEVVLYFNNKSNYDEFTAAGFAPKIPGFASTADAETWTYYSFDQSRPNVLTGRGQNEGVFLFLRNQDGTNHGLQVGSNGANDKNNEYGLSTWFSYSGSSNGNGDINANLLCEIPECTVECPSDLELDCTASTAPEFTGYPTLSCTDNNACARPAGEFDFEFQAWGGSTEGWSFGPGWQVGDGCAPSCGTFPNVFIDYSNFHSPYNTKLKSPVYDACCTDEVYVSFCMQQDLFGSSSEPGFIDVQYRVNGGNWHTVASYESIHGATINYNDSYLLPDAAGQNFEVRFKAYGNGSTGYTMGGWGLDNVRIFGLTAGCTPSTGEVEITWDYNDEVVGNCPTVITRTFTASFNNEDFTCVQTLTVSDEEAPIFIETPEDAEYVCLADVEDSAVTVIDNCDNDVQVSMEESIEGDDCHATILRTFTATDDCNNTATFTQTIVVNDNEVPFFTFVPEVIAGTCDDVLGSDMAVAEDNCSEVTVTFVDQFGEFTEDNCGMFRTQTPGGWGAPAAGLNPGSYRDANFATAFPNGLTIGCDNTLELSTAADVQAFLPSGGTPSILPAGSLLNPSDYGNSFAGHLVALKLSLGFDANDPNFGDAFGFLGDLIINNGPFEGTTVSELVAIADEVIGGCSNAFSPSELTAALTLVNENYVDGATDNGNLTCVNNEVCGYFVTRVFTATDACGNTAVATQCLSVVDTEAPVIDCPADITIDCTSATTPDVTGMASATDDCSEPGVSFVDGPVSGDCPYSFVRTWTAIDACENESTCEQIITIVDTEAPVISGEDGEATFECDMMPALVPPSVSDNCDDSVELVFDSQVIPGDCPNERTEVYTWTATDLCGNTSVRTITWNFVDTTAPVLGGIPADMTIECDEDMPNVNVFAIDNCDDNPMVSLSAETLPLDCGYQLIRTWTAVDACGNSDQASQVVTVVDTTDPVATFVPESVTIECDEEEPNDQPTFTDNCDDELEISAISGINNVTDCGYTIERSWTATDDCGNAVTVSQTITVVDTTAPVIECPADYVVNCDNGSSDPAFAGTPVTSDNCSEVTLTFVDGMVSGDDCPATFERVWTATDVCGNSSSCTQMITINDFAAPVIDCPADITIDCTSAITPDVTGMASATDDCSEPIISFADGDITGDCPYSFVRTWTAVDPCGNSTSCEQIITIVDTEAPVISGEDGEATFECNMMPTLIAPSVTDNCDDSVELVFDSQVIPGDCPNERTEVYTWTATDLCGNTSVRTITWNFVDTTAPVLGGIPADMTIECDEDMPNVNVFAIDNCDDNPMVSLSAETLPLDCGYQLIRTWTALDACGNSDQASQVVTVVDTTDPVATFVPESVTIECDEEEPNDQPIFTDNCDDELEISAISGINNVTDCGYTIERSWTATDDCGNAVTVSQTITVVDTTAPVIECPADYVVNCDNGSSDPAFAGTPVTSDNCSEVTLTFVDGMVSGDDCPATFERVWTATDVCGNSSSCTQMITINDFAAPVIDCPADITIDCTSAITPDVTGMASATDDCSEPIISFADGDITGDCPYSFVRTWTAVDPCGNSTSCEQIITIVDTEAPVISGEDGEATFECNMMPTLIAPSVTDNCDDSVELVLDSEIIPGDCPNERTEVYTWTATDLCGNTSVRTITWNFVDTTAPVFDAEPADLTIDCSDDLPLEAVSATDNCDEDVQVSVSISEESLDCGSIITRTFTAVDACGNEASISQTITKVDTTAPVITCPADYVVNCDNGSSDPADAGMATATDDCSAVEITFVDGPVSGDCPSSFERTWTAMDAWGNSTSCVQLITINDFSSPIIDCPEDITIDCTSASTPDVTGMATATDDCSEPVITYVDGPVTGDCPFTFDRIFTATDACGNESSSIQVITIIDTEAPVFSGEDLVETFECDMMPELIEPTVTDNCDENLEVVLSSEVLPGDCANERTEVYTWTATDACGNSSTRTITWNFVDTTAPVLGGIPANQTIECDEEVPNVNVFAIDNCDPNPMVSLTAETLPLDCGYQLIRTWTAVDACGNSAQSSQVLTVVDTTEPVATFVPQSVTIECDEEEPSEQPIFTDNCDDELEIFAISGINNVSDCGYTIERSWTAVDDCGNASTVTQTIVVVDTTAPEISDAPEDVTVDCSEIPAPVELTATDNCDDNPVVTFNEEMTTGCPYQLIRTWTASDACGNTSFATQVITVIDTEAPILVGVPDDVSGECGTVPSSVQVTATDNCDDNVPVTFSEEVIGESCPLTVVRTWTAVDNCGNSVSASQTIEINDVTAPVFTETPEASVTVECDNVPSASVSEVMVEDNCDLNPTVELSETIIPGVVLEEGLEPCGYSIERVWTATDLCGNESSFTQVVSVVDTTAPVLIGVPADLTAECDDLPAAPAVSAVDNCYNGEMEVSLTESIVAMDCGYQLIRTWTVADNCLNEASATQTITVVDTTAPAVISTPADEVVECDEALPTGAPQFDDNCDDMLTVSLEESIIDQACGYQLIRTWTAIDDCENSVSTSQTITVVDTTDPVLVDVPADATVECSAIPAVANVSATDNCDDNVLVSFSETVNAGDCPYTIVRTWTAIDECGNMDVASQILTVVDTEAPVLIGVPANIETDCNNIPAVAVVSATDNCAENLVPSFTQSMEALEDCGYSITRTWSVSDDCGNSAVESQVIFVIDTEVPTLVSGPQDLSLSCDEEIPFVAPVFEDDCDEQLEVSFSETVSPGTCENNFTLVRTWVASDDCGNSTSFTQNIEVSDTSAPVLVDVPADAEVECDAIPAPVSVSAIDNCDTDVTVSFSESIEVLECGKIITRTWTATDNCDNSSSESQVLTVVDNTAPVVVFEPQDITISCDEEEPIATPIFDDNCDDDLTVVATSSITMLDCGYQINRVWAAIDDCGNSVNANQTITVVDTEAPVLIDVPADASVECDAIPAPANVSAEDNCDADLNVTFSEAIIGDGCPYQIIRTWTVSDECGNSSTESQTLTVIDTTAPVLLGVPADATVECDAIPVAATVSATDNCATGLMVEFAESVEILDCGSVITRTWSAVDECGNNTSASQILTVIDTTAPVLIGVPADDTVECDAVPAIAQVGASDNCTLDLEVFFSEAVEVLDCGYILTRTWSVTDDCDNTTSESQTLTVVDTTVPVIVSAPADINVECDAVPGPGMLEVTDNCDPMPAVTVSEEVNELECGFEVIRTYTATDNCGNEATHVQTITVQDTTEPEITGVPANITIDCGDPVPAPGQVSVEDNCDPMPVVTVTEVTELLDCGSQIIRTYTATDECGNSAQEIQVITITDTEAPIFDNMVEDFTVNCEDLTIAPTVTASDNCSANVVVTLEEIQGEGCPYTIQRTWTAVDGCGNEATMTQVVTVIDEVAPVFEEHDFFISLSCELVDDYILTASDNCDADVTVEIIQELTFSGGCLGVLERIYQATDDCGNVTTTTQLIQQVDNVAPELFNVPENVTIDCEDEVPAVADDVFATDNCTEDVNLSFTEVQTNDFCPYEIIRTWTAVDQCGNVTEGVQVITVTVETPLQVTLLTYPNPMDDRFTLEFSVPRDAQVIARVYDMTGREVLQVFEGKADARRQYDLFFEGLDWKAGAYILMMTVDDKVYNHRIIVTQN